MSSSAVKHHRARSKNRSVGAKNKKFSQRKPPYSAQLSTSTSNASATKPTKLTKAQQHKALLARREKDKLTIASRLGVNPTQYTYRQLLQMNKERENCEQVFDFHSHRNDVYQKTRHLRAQAIDLKNKFNDATISLEERIAMINHAHKLNAQLQVLDHEKDKAFEKKRHLFAEGVLSTFNDRDAQRFSAIKTKSARGSSESADENEPSLFIAFKPSDTDQPSDTKSKSTTSNVLSETTKQIIKSEQQRIAKENQEKQSRKEEARAIRAELLKLGTSINEEPNGVPYSMENNDGYTTTGKRARYVPSSTHDEDDGKADDNLNRAQPAQDRIAIQQLRAMHEEYEPLTKETIFGDTCDKVIQVKDAKQILVKYGFIFDSPNKNPQSGSKSDKHGTLFAGHGHGLVARHPSTNLKVYLTYNDSDTNLLSQESVKRMKFNMNRIEYIIYLEDKKKVWVDNQPLVRLIDQRIAKVKSYQYSVH